MSILRKPLSILYVFKKPESHIQVLCIIFKANHLIYFSNWLIL